jgi:hypothetical protein
VWLSSSSAISVKYYQTTGLPHNPSHPVCLVNCLPYQLYVILFPISRPDHKYITPSIPAFHELLLLLLAQQTLLLTCVFILAIPDLSREASHTKHFILLPLPGFISKFLNIITFNRKLEYQTAIMAVAAQPQVNPSWSRWPQHTPSSFSIMSSPGFTPYDPRSQVSNQMQRQVSAPYLMGSTYNHSPLSAVSPPQYQNHNTFSYVPYHSPPPSTPLGSPFKTEFREHPYMVTEASVVDQRNLQSMKEYQPYSPISRRESISSSTHSSITPGPATPGSYTSGPISLSPATLNSFITARLDNSKTLAYNETLDPADKIEFRTDVDELMKAIQGSRAKEDYQQHLLSPAPTPEYVATPPSALPTQSGKPRKLWICDGPSCGRAFTQKTHRDIHQRTHTGYRPYVSIWLDF